MIKNEIGGPFTDFDQVVSLDSEQVPNIGVLLAKRFKLPFAAIRHEPLPGPCLTANYGPKFKRKTLYL